MSETTTNSQGPPQYVGYVHICCEHAEQLRAEVAWLRGVLLDFAENGTRHDLHPTLSGYDLGTPTPGGRGWHTYIREMDDYVRERARAALEGKDA